MRARVMSPCPRGQGARAVPPAPWSVTSALPVPCPLSKAGVDCGVGPFVPSGSLILCNQLFSRLLPLCLSAEPGQRPRGRLHLTLEAQPQMEARDATPGALTPPASCPAPCGGRGSLTLLTGEGLRAMACPRSTSDLRPPAPPSPSVRPAAGPSVTHTTRLRAITSHPSGASTPLVDASQVGWWPETGQPPPPLWLCFSSVFPHLVTPRVIGPPFGSAACRNGRLTRLHLKLEHGPQAEVCCFPLCPQDSGQASPSLCADGGSLSCSRHRLGSSGCEPCCRGRDPQDARNRPLPLPTLGPWPPSHFPLTCL